MHGLVWLCLQLCSISSCRGSLWAVCLCSVFYSLSSCRRPSESHYLTPSSSWHSHSGQTVILHIMFSRVRVYFALVHSYSLILLFYAFRHIGAVLRYHRWCKPNISCCCFSNSKPMGGFYCKTAIGNAVCLSQN